MDPAPAGAELLKVKTRIPYSEETPVYVRLPKGFVAAPHRSYRAVIYVPGLSGHPAKLVKNGDENGKLLEAADRRQWFVIVPAFDADKGKVRDRKKCFYYPESGSGNALIAILRQVAKKYPISTDHLFVCGESAGAQFSHRFALAYPDKVTAVVVDHSSWFDPPTPRAAGLAWLVTIGEADPSFRNSLEFFWQLQDVGAKPVFRSQPGMLHEKNDAIKGLIAAFLEYYDEKTAGDLIERIGGSTAIGKPLVDETSPFVGESIDWKYYPNSEDNREAIAEEDRVYLPGESVARAWGTPAEEH